MIIKVKQAKKNVTDMFPVRFALPGKIGIKPNKLLIQIKKKIVSKNGTNFLYFFSFIFALAMSS